MNNIYTRILGIVLLSMMCWTGPVMGAQSYDIKEMTPEVLSALDGRRERYETLIALKAEGVLGENNSGYVEVLKNEGDAQAVADGENADRKVIYQTIADQNNLTDALGTIEAVFASVQREKASSGDMIQTESGAWISK